MVFGACAGGDESLPASNQGDCLTCGPVDPITLNYGSATDWSQDKTFLQYAYEGSECENRSSMSWPAQGCMNKEPLLSA